MDDQRSTSFGGTRPLYPPNLESDLEIRLRNLALAHTPARGAIGVMESPARGFGDAPGVSNHGRIGEASGAQLASPSPLPPSPSHPPGNLNQPQRQAMSAREFLATPRQIGQLDGISQPTSFLPHGQHRVSATPPQPATSQPWSTHTPPPPPSSQPVGPTAQPSYSFDLGRSWEPQAPSVFRPNLPTYLQANIGRAVEHLTALCQRIVPGIEISNESIVKREEFRIRIESVCRHVVSLHVAASYPGLKFDPSSVRLKCFGSLASGFATNDSDMDLGLFLPETLPPPDVTESPIPRLLEKGLLDSGLGARLLIRTRVPILKLCENPTEKLRFALLQERASWEAEACLPPVSPRRSEPTEPLLPQSESMSLSEYYWSAQAYLNLAGVHDIMASNQQLHDVGQYLAVEDVSRQFVEGIRDPALRDRLGGVISDSPTHADIRSLHSVYLQAEGEHILLCCKNRRVAEPLPSQEAEIATMSAAWQRLVYQAGHITDLVGFTKELEAAVFKFKSMPSIGLALFKQGPNESVTQYHHRLRALLKTLRPTGMLLSVDEQAAVADQYVAGIRCTSVRNATRKLIQNRSSELGAEYLLLSHRRAQLACNLEKAISGGHYPADSVGAISMYVDLLKNTPLPTSQVPRTGILVACVSGYQQTLLQRVSRTAHPPEVGQNLFRDRSQDRLDFPSSGVGIQCDINFSAHLALENTLLLRCYSHSDTRVRPFVLFIKHWVKARGINSAYRGTLGGYGYVLMILHYLVNIVKPSVCPNLQVLGSNLGPGPTPESQAPNEKILGRDVRFWRAEADILQLAVEKKLSHNTQTIGHLLCGFFEYYAHSGTVSSLGLTVRGFDWGRDVLSLRTLGGLLSKQHKGWTEARTVFGSHYTGGSGNSSRARSESGSGGQDMGFKEAGHRHRYMLAIEDPFELDHNVARTVTHYGIVLIREEFRRAWNLIQDSGFGGKVDLCDNINKASHNRPAETSLINDLLRQVHGTNCLSS